jgi:hypothetical protein
MWGQRWGGRRVDLRVDVVQYHGADFDHADDPDDGHSTDPRDRVGLG